METIFCPFCQSVLWDVKSEDTSGTFEDSNFKHFAYCLDCKARGPEKNNSVDAMDAWRETAERVNDPVYREGKF